MLVYPRPARRAHSVNFMARRGCRIFRSFLATFDIHINYLLREAPRHDIEEFGTFEFVSKALLVLETWFVKGWVYTYKP